MVERTSASGSRRLSLYFDLLVIEALFIPFTDRSQRALDIIAKIIVARDPGRDPRWTGWVVCLLLPLAAVLALMGLLALCAPDSAFYFEIAPRG